jgi:hypothetical protein
MRSLIVLLFTFVFAAPMSSAAQQRQMAGGLRSTSDRHSHPGVRPRLGAATLTRARPATARQDSLKNGAVVGAVVGIAAALFGVYLCNAVGEEGDPPCWRGALALGAIGAGVGAAAGIGIDAARSRQPAIRQIAVHVRF